jgi:NTE family protein
MTDRDGDGAAALALGGGGARSAYQVGVLRALARRIPQARFPILTGVSAGAINAAILANHVGSFGDAVESLAGLWNALELSDVFHTTPMTLLKRLWRTGAQLASGVSAGEDVVEGMVDTSPLREFLRRRVGATDGSLPGIAANLRDGRLRAVAITATRYATGESVTFCAGRPVREWKHPWRTAVPTELTLEHVMASSALPLFYPAVFVDGAWYGDGEIGLSKPLSPALHLGAGKILAISTWNRRDDPTVAEATRHPAPGEVMSVLYGVLFADRIDHDAAELERVNRFVRGRPPQERFGYREAKLLVVRPSVDLGAVACGPDVAVPRSLRFLARRLDLRRARSRDLLSVVMLDHDCIARLIEVGERDGERCADDVAVLLAE